MSGRAGSSRGRPSARSSGARPLSHPGDDRPAAGGPAQRPAEGREGTRPGSGVDFLRTLRDPVPGRFEPMNVDPASNEPIVVLLPLYNDWESLRLLLVHLDEELSRRGTQARVLAVDDGSPQPPPNGLAWGPFESIVAVQVLSLHRNLGHQRAIAIGLAYVEQHVECPCVVVMDSDGEDSPADVPRLLSRFDEEGQSKIVFAERTKRSESLIFMSFYLLYRWLHLLLTGVRVRVGNFSVIPRSRLESLVTVSELWNHYAAAVFKSEQPHCSVPTRRAKRLSGRSRMNFVGLVTHGFERHFGVQRHDRGAVAHPEFDGLRPGTGRSDCHGRAQAGAGRGVARLGDQRRRNASDHHAPDHDADRLLLFRHPGRTAGDGLHPEAGLCLLRRHCPDGLPPGGGRRAGTAESEGPGRRYQR